MSKFISSKETYLKYILYFFPLLVILGNAYINFALISVFSLYIISCLIEKRLIYSGSDEFKYFLFFYIYLIFNSLLADDFITSILRTLPYVKFFIFILIFKDLIEKGKIDFKKLIFVWFSIIFILSLDIIYQSIKGHDIFNYVSEYKTRNSGFFFDELVAGGFLVSFVPICIFLLFKKNENFFIFVFFTFFLVVIFLTGERANLIDFIIISICIYFFCIKSNLFLKLFSIISISLILVLLILSLENFKQRYLTTISFSDGKNLNLIDTYLTSEYGSHSISTIFMLKDNLLFGVGNKNFRKVCKKYEDKVIQFQKKIDERDRKKNVYPNGCGTHPHQIYYELLSEHGLIGFLIIIFLMFKLIFKNFSIKNKNNLNRVCLIYIIIYFIPILPSGSLFSTLTSTFFWINYLFYVVSIPKHV